MSQIVSPDGEPARCESCGYPYGRIVRYIIRSGATQTRFQCDGCQRLQGFSLPRTLTGDPARFPVALDRSREVRCAYRGCTNPGAELHHWAPRHIFGAAESGCWPVGYLCVAHHQLWHRRMNAAIRLTVGRAA